MKHPIFFLLCILSFWANAQTSIRFNRDEKNLNSDGINENPCCSIQQMKRAWYETSAADTFNTIKNLDSKFIVLVDTNTRAINFVSFYEAYQRRQSIKLDTSAFSLLNIEGWKNSSVHVKQAIIKERMALSKQQADSIHARNNQGQHQIWLINNTKEKVAVQMQDGSYICVLQALDKNGQWTSIESWRFSWCGNSYYEKVFEPNAASSFVTMLHNNGDFETRLRFKLLGTDQFHYSNEFLGKINSFDLLKESKFQ